MPRLLPLLLALLSPWLVVTACADTSSAPDDATPGVDLRACASDATCLGGEVCRDGFCRTVCGPDRACTGALTVCDLAAGVCVACTDNTHCTQGQVCEARVCISRCARDADCGPGETCDPTSLQCLQRRCQSDGQCQGGETCREGVCRPIGAGTCVPGVTRCDGNTLLRCDREGSVEEIAGCTGGLRCEQGGGLARCVAADDNSCRPGETGCLNASNRWICQGGSRVPDACVAGERCQEGQCRSASCRAGESRCEGDRLFVCDGSTGTEIPVACDLTPECQGNAFGCTCGTAGCTPRVCRPGTNVCEGGNLRVCEEDGLRLSAPRACESGTSCVGGSCVPTSCSRGQTRCSNDVQLYCIGDGWDTTDCAVRGQTCVEDGLGAQCVDRVCDPNSTRCSGDNTRLWRCNARGTAENQEPCPSNTFCQRGTCVANVCAPGDRRCGQSGPERCNESGTGWLPATPCPDGQFCRDGICESISGSECRADAECPAPTAYCATESRLIRYSGNGRCRSGTCDFSTVTESVDCGASGARCDSTTRQCVAQPTGCSSSDDCTGGQVCLTSASPRRCVECTRDSHCRSGQRCSSNNNCVGEGVGDCRTDAECALRAAALGGTEQDVTRARCDAVVGCFTMGRCGQRPSGGTSGDVFGSSCREGLVCGDALGLFPDRCNGCTVSSNAGCRSGEVCRESFFPFPLPGFGASCEAPDSAPLPF